MHQVTIHEARTNLSKLIQEALAGEDVIIARGKTPVARMEPLPGAVVKRRLGTARNLVLEMPDDFFETLVDFDEYTP
ncbi:MAG: type II toxin-antitoxin system prevent-host-death family antitoxin [Chitinivibrionales bacterium]|nr:type II toxin-antitoxin system prevent-host-death family antitoxin [Chitinivibrionales bacterium]